VQVLRYWSFGAVWCRIWLAVDVWLCTASIFNLCAISIDRYVAISRPVKYPTLMSPRRARLLIICVWILSFIICFPPLIGWNEHGRLDFSDDVTNAGNWTQPHADDVVASPDVQQLLDDDSQYDARYSVIDAAGVGDSFVTSRGPGAEVPVTLHHSHVVGMTSHAAQSRGGGARSVRSHVGSGLHRLLRVRLVLGSNARNDRLLLEDLQDCRRGDRRCESRFRGAENKRTAVELCAR